MAELPSDFQFVHCQVAAAEALGGDCSRLELTVPAGFAPAGVRPGQFVMIRGAWGHHPVLPRAFSVLASAPGRLELLVKVVGRGTRRLAAVAVGDSLSLLGPLGQAFPESLGVERDLLVGGGSGIPPLYLQAERAVAAGHGAKVSVIYGGRRAVDLGLLPRLKTLGVDLHPCTEDGSLGARGRVTELLAPLLEAGGARVLACGPTPMLEAVTTLCETHGSPCFISLETEMACGLGICRGCMVARANGDGYACTCQEGPVFDAREVVP